MHFPKETAMTVTKPIALLAAALLTAAAVADAGDKNKSMTDAGEKFDTLDTNQDRAISQSEAAKDETLAAVFASVDANNDGEVSRSEYTAQLSEKDGQRSTSDY
jgi:ABC-type transporter MlaC component